jgi:hypothetical protein
MFRPAQREEDPEMKIAALTIVGTASLVASANAGFLGFVASVHTVGSYTVIDVFAGVSNASDKFLNVYNSNISTSLSGGFYQSGGQATKTWKPNTGAPWQTRNSIDSFMTAGTFGGGAYAGEFFASANTNGDPNFTRTSWNATPTSGPANTVPLNAGWYTGDPTSIDNTAESLAGMVGRINTGITAGVGTPGQPGYTAGSVGTANANYGIWCAHLVVAGIGTIGGANANIAWTASVSIKDGVNGVTDQRVSSFAVPAPGALALLGCAGLAARRRRA